MGDVSPAAEELKDLLQSQIKNAGGERFALLCSLLAFGRLNAIVSLGNETALSNDFTDLEKQMIVSIGLLLAVGGHGGSILYDPLEPR